VTPTIPSVHQGGTADTDLERGAMTDHDPSFEQDIRPRFRPMDVEEMSFAFDLSSYDEVRENAEGIYERLANGTMPCDAPWSEDDLDRFRAWIDAGMPA
jgi:hypothetical protein